MLKTRTVSRAAVTALLSVALIAQAPIARAAIVDTEAMTAQTQSEQDRSKIQSFVERADVKSRLQAMGVGGLLAKDRVAAMSEEEVHALAQRIDTLPAGGNLSQTDLILILLIAILVAIVI